MDVPVVAAASAVAASTSSPADPTVADDPDLFHGECASGPHAGRYTFRWHHSWARVTKNQHGVTGWATIKKSALHTEVGTIIRVHKCANNPCTAMWSASKYGVCGAPRHVQAYLPDASSAAVAVGSAAVAAGSTSSAALTATESDNAVSASSCDGMPVPPELPPLPPPNIPPPDVTVSPPAPSAPSSSDVPCLSPPAPTADDGKKQLAAVAGAKPVAQPSMPNLELKLLTLARDIRRPMTYVGYSASFSWGCA